MQTENRPVVVANALVEYQVREEMLEGRPHIVAPVVSLTEGVHKRLLYLAEDIGHYPNVWDGEPVVVQHPMEGDTPISANSPALHNQGRIGRLFSTNFDAGTKKLRHELWIDVALAQSRAPVVLEKVRSGAPLEVSTGLWGDVVGGPGVWNGEEYDGRLVNHKPDHLALLPGGVGACSWGDGCGVRANEEGEKMEGSAGASSVTLAMAEALRKQGFLVLEKGHEDISANESDDPTPQSNSTGCSCNREDLKLKKNEAVQALIACERTRFDEKDEGWLLGLSEEQLEKLMPSEAETPAEVGAETPAEVGAETPAEVDEETPPVTAEEYVNQAPEAIREVLRNGLTEINEKRKALIKKIVTNAGKVYTAKDLEGREIPELQKIAQLADLNPNYSGRGGSAPVDNSENDNSVPIPPRVFEAAVASK